MKKTFLGIGILLVSLFVNCNVHAIELSRGFSSSSGNVCANPGATDTIDLHYDYDSNKDDNQKPSKIQIDFSLPSGFSVSPSSSQMIDSEDSIVKNGENSYSLVIGTHEFTIYYTGILSFDIKATSSTEEKKYDFSATAKVINASGSVIETKNISINYIVLNEDDNDNCDDNSNVTSATMDGQNITSANIDTNNASVNFKFNLESPKSKIYQIIGDSSKELVNGEAKIDLNYGANNLQFRVESECKALNENRKKLYDSCQEYANNTSIGTSSHEIPVLLSVNRIDNRSKVNTLRSLTISDVSINFNPDLKTYMATVPYKVSSVNINALLTDNKASFVPGYGNRKVNLNEGTNDVQIKVKAENGEEAVYTIKINRELNDDATLRSIKVGDKEITIKKDLLKYSIRVENNVINPTIEINATDGNAKIERDEIKELQEGSNLISITVTASKGNKLVYNLDIIRDTLISTNSKLKDIIIKNNDFKFDSTLDTFNVHITSDVDKLDLEIIPEHEKAKYVVIGNKNLKDKSQVKIKVTAEDDKTVSNYTLNITKDPNKINILFIIIPAIVVLGVVVFIIIKKKKTKKNVKETESGKEDNNTSLKESETTEEKIEREEEVALDEEVSKENISNDTDK